MCSNFVKNSLLLQSTVCRTKEYNFLKDIVWWWRGLKTSLYTVMIEHSNINTYTLKVLYLYI